MTSPESFSPGRRRVVLAVLCLSVLLVVMANMALNVALPTLGRQLHASATALQWVVDSYVLCFAGLLLPAGAAADRFGRKRCLQAGLAVFAVAAGLGAFAGSAAGLIAARAVMGAGAALVMPATLAILGAVFPPDRRPAAIAVWAAVAGAGVAVSITWSGLILERFWWGSIFLGMAAVAVLALLAGLAVLPPAPGTGRARPDLAGAALSTAGLTGLLYGLIEAPDYGWMTLNVLAPAGTGLALLAAFVAWERRAPRPMLDLRLVTDRRLVTGSLAIMAAYFALFGMYFLLTQYLQLVRGYSPLAAGLYALPAGLAQLVTANLARPLGARWGTRPLLTAGLAASAAGLLALAACGTASSPLVFEAALALLGAGIGLTMPPATGAIMAAVPPARAGVGSAINDLARELGGALGVGLLGSIALARYHAAVAAAWPAASEPASRGLAATLAAARSAPAALAARQAFCSGLHLAMTAGALTVLAAAAILAWQLPRAPAKPPARPAPSRKDPLKTPAEAL